jgi:hypothetical protein
MTTRAFLSALTIFAAAVPAISAQSAASSDVLRASAVIDSIDSAQRLITFRDPDGRREMLQAPPEVKRFDELKVGDTLNLTYYYARVYQVQKAGTGVAGPVGTSGADPRVTPTGGALPGATITRRLTETVLVKATDLDNRLLTVVRADGQIVKRKVQDPALMKGIVADDRIEVTYSEGLLLDFERP